MIRVPASGSSAAMISAPPSRSERPGPAKPASHGPSVSADGDVIFPPGLPMPRFTSTESRSGALIRGLPRLVAMRILVLGGTSFVGRAIVTDALQAGAEVTLFGRGRTGAGLFPGVRRLTGDRDTGDYAALRDGRWDAVVDVSGYVPRHVGQAMDALGADRSRPRALGAGTNRPSVGRYLFIS